MPRVTLTALDHERLSGLARAALRIMPDVAASLAEEFDRAHVLPKERKPIDAVNMGCEVEFRDESSGRIQKMTLVYPSEAGIEQGNISVLTPAGNCADWTWNGVVHHVGNPGRPTQAAHRFGSARTGTA